MDRRFPIVDFDAQRFSEFFDKETESLRVKLLSGGACNSNYLVQTGREKYVCKIYSRGNPQLDSSILKLTKGLLPTPEYLWTGDGVCVMNYIEGKHFEPTQNLAREAGRMIARLSKISFNCSGEIKPDGRVAVFKGWSTYKEGLFALLAHPNSIEYLDSEAIRVRLRH